MHPESNGLVPLLPPRRVLFREFGAADWVPCHFTILGSKHFLEPQRSLQPLGLTLVTDVPGFDSTEVPGLDLFAALASAMLTIESLILAMRNGGEVQLREGAAFDAEFDTVFFGSRIQRLRESLVPPN